MERTNFQLNALLDYLLDVDTIYLQVQHLLENQLKGLLFGCCKQKGPEWRACGAGPGIS